MDSKDFLVMCKSETLILIPSVKDVFSKNYNIDKLDSDRGATILHRMLHIRKYLLPRYYLV